MSLIQSRVSLGDGFIKRRQKTRVTFIALVGPARSPFFPHKSRPRLQCEAAEFVRLQIVQFSFNLSETHNGMTLSLPARKDKRGREMPM